MFFLLNPAGKIRVPILYNFYFQNLCSLTIGVSSPVSVYTAIFIHFYTFFRVCFSSTSALFMLLWLCLDNDMCVQLLGHALLFATPWTTACQAPLSMGFPRQEYWSGLPFPPPVDLRSPGTEPSSPVSPALAGRFFTTEPAVPP